jgi:maltose alpha-D-glucosyltransferase/alpha-amylase
VGDFKGLITKLDYLADLGVTTLWLLPFYPSPLRDDGYDIADYYSVHPSYGTLDDFRRFLDEAHRRDLRVITELVINHTSDQHPWFQRARRSPPGSEARNYYVWSDTPNKYREARIIFKDFEPSNWSWDPVAKAYFWHRFYSHQPDLNFDNPVVQAAVFEMLDYWFGMGVDGLRLDAVPYLYEREGTNCENLAETHAYLKKLRAHIDKRFEGRMLLAEANQWPEDAVAYFGHGDECHMAFHFPVMPRMFMSLQMEDRFPIIDILQQTPPIPENCQWASFLRNHDELTLEMVTDEERDYMYRVYASDPRARINLGIRRRLAPLLGNSRRKIELMNILLLSLPGTPIIYYGDEIGMGDNFYLGDRNGVRTPMQWSPDRNAGFSKANPQQLYLPTIIDSEYHYEAVNVEVHERNLSSLLWWTRRVIAMRKRFPAFGSGTIEFLYPDNPKVLAFVRQYQGETILVLVNLSRFAQAVEIDLAGFAGQVPVEVFSQNRFPAIKQGMYFFTLAPHDHYWLHLEGKAEPTDARTEYAPPFLNVEPNWHEMLEGPSQAHLEQRCVIPWMQNNRRLGRTGEAVRAVHTTESIALDGEQNGPRLTFVDTTYVEAEPETYVLPLQITSGDGVRNILSESPESVIARCRGTAGESVLHDALENEDFRASLLDIIINAKRMKCANGELVGVPGAALGGLIGDGVRGTTRLVQTGQANPTISYDNRLFLKLYRRLENGTNPDAELIRYLSENRKFENVPAFCGAIEFRAHRAPVRTVAMLMAHVPNSGDAWGYTLDSVIRYYERVLERHPETGQIEDDAVVTELIGGVYPERARLLAQRTGEMHLALAADTEDPDFAPEPFTTLNQRSLYQSMRGTTRRMIQLVRKGEHTLPEVCRREILGLLELEPEILERQARLISKKVEATRTRVHGDYHLGQVLHTGKDFVIIDFEGEPARSLGERRMKRSPLRDVAGMMRSFHYAAYAALWQQRTLRGVDTAYVEPWAEIWARRIGETFLDSYLETTRGASFIPAEPEALQILLEASLLEKAAYELAYELNNRPDWATIAARGIRSLLKPERAVKAVPAVTT